MNAKAVIVLNLIVVLFGLNTGCDSDPEFLPGLEGNMVGYLYSFDEYGILLEDHSGFKITAMGHAGTHQILSDANGRFEFIALPTGTYELHFKKEGFGTLKQFGVQHLGGKATILLLEYFVQTKHYFLYEISKTRIQHLLIDKDTLSAAFIFPDETLPREASLYLYFSTEDGFDIQEAQFTWSKTLFEEEGVYTGYPLFTDSPFKSGERIYYRAGYFTRPWEWLQHDMHLYDFYGPDSYLDYESNQIIFPNLGEISEQYSFVLEK
ncbi:MAG: carboxypeptidase regulatory-like domain-containing protein [Bacteroidia bacterium]|nr:MAG: carboxypeptidase regulatory-like domain-containing protein [Bacteroidia bacterium]